MRNLATQAETQNVVDKGKGKEKEKETDKTEQDNAGGSQPYENASAEVQELRNQLKNAQVQINSRDSILTLRASQLQDSKDEVQKLREAEKARQDKDQEPRDRVGDSPT